MFVLIRLPGGEALRVGCASKRAIQSRNVHYSLVSTSVPAAVARSLY